MGRIVSILCAGLLACVLLTGCKTLDSVRDTLKQAIDSGFIALEEVENGVMEIIEAVTGEGESAGTDEAATDKTSLLSQSEGSVVAGTAGGRRGGSERAREQKGEAG